MSSTLFTNELTSLHRSGKRIEYLHKCVSAALTGNEIEKTISSFFITRLHRAGIKNLNNTRIADAIKQISNPSFIPLIESLSEETKQQEHRGTTIVRLNLGKEEEPGLLCAQLLILEDSRFSITKIPFGNIRLTYLIAIVIGTPANIIIVDHPNPCVMALAIAFKNIWGSLLVQNYNCASQEIIQELEARSAGSRNLALVNDDLDTLLASKTLISTESISLLMPLFDARLLQEKSGARKKFIINTKAYNSHSYAFNTTAYTGIWLEGEIQKLTNKIIVDSYALADSRKSRDNPELPITTLANNRFLHEASSLAENLLSKSPKLIELLSVENEKYASSYLATKKKADNKKLSVLIGTLYSGESEIHSLERSLSLQTYPISEHYIVRNLPNVEAHNKLYEYFLASNHDIMIKLDADMVVIDRYFIESIAKGCIWSSSCAIVQSAIFDFYSGGEIQGVNSYTKLFRWNSEKTDQLFTDRSAVKGLNRIVIWNTFIKSVIHCPSPHPFQAFHFGVHRAHKAKVAYLAKNYESAIEQLVYLEKLSYRYKSSVSSRQFMFAYIGYLYGTVNTLKDSEINYTNDGLRSFFENIQSLRNSELDALIHSLEQKRSKIESDSFASLASAARRTIGASIHRIALILPHLLSFGGVFRFIELSIRFRSRGIDAPIVVPDNSLDPDRVSWISENYQEVKVIGLTKALKQEWDVVVCGDFSSGLMCYLPLFRSRLRCAYLLNGWQHRLINVKQIQAASPEIVFANSSYCASHYHDLYPRIVPGGIDFKRVSSFKKGGQRDLCLSSDPIKIICPSGRRKPRKRFDDAVKAVSMLAKKGYIIEFHTFDIVDIRLEVIKGVHHVHHLSISRNALFRLFSEMDLGIYPEEDAGWNNPVAEAAACCLPVVCTPAGTSDFIEHSVSGYVVPPRSPEALAECLENLIVNPQLRELHAENAFESIKSFDWQKVADQLIECFEETRKFSACPSHAGLKGVKSLLATYDSGL